MMIIDDECKRHLTTSFRPAAKHHALVSIGTDNKLAIRKGEDSVPRPASAPLAV